MKRVYRVDGGVFFKGLQQNGLEFPDETQFLAKETLQNLARFLLAFILIRGRDKHDRLLVQFILNGLRKAPAYRSSECHVFELFVFEYICSDFWKTAKFTLSRYSRTAQNGVVYK